MAAFKPTKLQKASVEALIEKWRPLLFLNEWHIKMGYSETPAPDDPGASAEIETDCTYKIATLTLFPLFFARRPEQQEHSVVHELCHCISGIVRNLAYKALVREKHVMWHTVAEADERCTQQFTNVIMELYRQRATIQ